MGNTLMDYILVCIIIVLIEAALVLGISSLICKYTNVKSNSDTRFYSVFCIVDSVLLTIVVAFTAVCLFLPANFGTAVSGALSAFYILPPFAIMLIIGLVSKAVKKNSGEKIDRLLSEAEDKIENAIKNSDVINKDKT